MDIDGDGVADGDGVIDIDDVADGDGVTDGNGLEIGEIVAGGEDSVLVECTGVSTIARFLRQLVRTGRIKAIQTK